MSVLLGSSGASVILGSSGGGVVRRGDGSGKTLLQPSDFTYLGYYDVAIDGLDSTFGKGFTHRYVGGDLRFLYFGISDAIREFSITGNTYGDRITTATDNWDISAQLTSRSPDRHVGVWWDSAGSRLWTLSAVDYNSSYLQGQIQTRTLGSSGATSNYHGMVGLNGIGAKRIYGGAQSVPAWFQSTYGVGPYVVGWGGYTSLMQAGGKCSMGPSMFAMADPTSITADTEAASFTTIMDGEGGSTALDWYGSGTPTTYDRGRRLDNCTNYLDGGDPRANPQSRPTDPPDGDAQWLSPSPDGYGRWTWGDSYYNTGCWIDGTTKHGFVAIGSFGSGYCWYENSSMKYDGRVYELHIFNPAHFGESINNTREPWDVRPTTMTNLSLTGMGTHNLGGNGTVGNIGGATFDTTTNTLYIQGNGVNTYDMRVFAYSVNMA